MAQSLSNTWKSALNTVAETVFPVNKTVRQSDRERIVQLQAGTYLASDLPLQMALYFNVWFSPIWLIICLVNFVAKYEKLESFYKFVMIVVYIVMGMVEVTRLYLGYAGNLQEREILVNNVEESRDCKAFIDEVPELAGFWLVTFLLQFPLTCMLLFNENALIMPTERAANIVMVVFLLIEVIQGYRTVKKMSENQVAKFHFRQFDDLIEMEEIHGRTFDDYGKLE